MKRILFVVVTLVLYLTVVGSASYAADRGLLGKLFGWIGWGDAGVKEVVDDAGISRDVPSDENIYSVSGLDPLPDPPLPPRPSKRDSGR